MAPAPGIVHPVLPSPSLLPLPPRDLGVQTNELTTRWPDLLTARVALAFYNQLPNAGKLADEWRKAVEHPRSGMPGLIRYSNARRLADLKRWNPSNTRRRARRRTLGKETLMAVVDADIVIYGSNSMQHVVNHWLRRMDAVAAFASARPQDGGTGAVYVLLMVTPGRRAER